MLASEQFPVLAHCRSSFLSVPPPRDFEHLRDKVLCILKRLWKFLVDKNTRDKHSLASRSIGYIRGSARPNLSTQLRTAADLEEGVAHVR